MIRDIVQTELYFLDYWMLAGQDDMADTAGNDDAAPGPSSVEAQPEHSAAQPNLLLYC